MRLNRSFFRFDLTFTLACGSYVIDFDGFSFSPAFENDEDIIIYRNNLT